MLFFEDDGSGIPAEYRDHLFEKGRGQNTGLGLFLSREILSMTGIGIDEVGHAQGGQVPHDHTERAPTACRPTENREVPFFGTLIFSLLPTRSEVGRIIEWVDENVAIGSWIGRQER